MTDGIACQFKSLTNSFLRENKTDNGAILHDDSQG